MDKLIDIKEVCRQIGFCKTKVWELAGSGDFPAPYYPCGRAARWSENEVQHWIELQKLAKRGHIEP